MLFPSFFVVDFNKYDKLPDVYLPENAFLSYKITAASIPLLDSFYQKLFLSSKKHRFCLLIDLEGELNNSALNKTIDFLVSFSFHFRYIKTSNDNPLVLFEINKMDADKYISIISKGFKSHGYNDIETLIIYNNPTSFPKNERNNIRFDLRENVNSLLSEYINSIKQLASSDSSFIFFLESPEIIPDILDTMQKAETIIQEDIPQTYYLLKESLSLRTKNDELLLKTELLQEQLDSLNNYHSFYSSSDIRYKEQITELQSFYNNEYEILPIWYKRFGHIIKVIMGKRSFRSLFNDSVKKYK